MANAGDIRAGRAYVEIGANSRKLPRDLKNAEKELRAFGDKVSQAGGSILLPALAFDLPAAASLKVFSDYADRMAIVRAVTGATADEFAALDARAKELGANTSFTASDVAEAMGELSKAGFSTNEVLASIDGTLATARAGALGLADATGIVTDTLRSFSLTADQAGRVGDVLAKTANVSSTDIGQIGQAMKYVASSSNMAGQSLESVSAALAVLGNRGLKADMAGTSLAQVFVQLTNGDVQKKLAGMGVAVMDAQGNMRDLIDIMRELGNATQGMGNADKLRLFTDLFDQRGMRAASMLSGNVKEWRSFTEVMKSAGGSAQKMANDLDNTLGGAFRNMTSALEGVQIAFGEALQMPLRDSAKWTAESAREIASFIQHHHSLVVALSAGGVALTAFGGGMIALGAAAKVAAVGADGLKLLSAWAGKLAEAYREQLAGIVTGIPAQQADTAAKEQTAAAEDRLTKSLSGATASMRAQETELAKIVSGLETLARGADAAALSMMRVQAALTAQAGGITAAVAEMRAAGAGVAALTTELLTMTVALKANTVASGRNSLSIAAQTKHMSALAAALSRTAKAYAAATAAQARYTGTAAASASVNGAVVAANNGVAASTVRMAAGTTAAAGAMTTLAAASSFDVSAALSNVATVMQLNDGIKSASDGLKTVSAKVIESSTAMRDKTSKVADAAKSARNYFWEAGAAAERFAKVDIGQIKLAELATKAQKAMAALRAVMNSFEFKAAVVVGSAYGGYALGNAWKQSNRFEYETEDNRENEQRTEQELSQAEANYRRMRELSATANRSSDETEELYDMLELVNNQYGVIDGSIESVIGSQEKLNSVMDEMRIKALDNRDIELAVSRGAAKRNLENAYKKRENLQGRVHSIGDVVTGQDLADIEAANTQIDQARTKYQEAQKKYSEFSRYRLRKISGIESGGAQYTGLNAQEFSDAQEKLTRMQEDAGRERQSDFANQLDDIRKWGVEYTKTLAQLSSAAEHFGDKDGARKYSELLKQAPALIEERQERIKTKRADEGRLGREKDLAGIDDRLAADADEIRRKRDDQIAEALTAQSPQGAEALFQNLRQKYDEKIAQLAEAARAEIKSAWADNEVTPDEQARIDAAEKGLDATRSRRAQAEEYLTRARDSAAQTWEVRGATGAGTAALGTGTSSVNQKIAQGLEDITKNTKELVDSFEKGLGVK